MTLRICPLASVDVPAVEALLDAAFGVDRRTRTAYAIRDGMTAVAALSFAALDENTLVATLQCWPVAVADVPVTLVGPVAVLPHHQGRGIGTMLMHHLIACAPDAPMVMIGDPEYYGRFGFTSAATRAWDVPGPVDRHRLLARRTSGIPVIGALGPRAFALAGSKA